MREKQTCLLCEGRPVPGARCPLCSAPPGAARTNETLLADEATSPGLDFSFEILPTDIPSLPPNADLARRRLSSFEAFFLTRLDCAATVEQLEAIMGLSHGEIRALLHPHVLSGLVVLHRPGRNAPRTADDARP